MIYHIISHLLIHWQVSVCHRNFPWTGPSLCSRKESAFLVMQWLKNHLRFLVNLGRIHTSHGKVKTWCRVFLPLKLLGPRVFHVKMVVFLPEYPGPFHNRSLTMSQNPGPPRNPLVLFAKSTVLGLIFDHHLWVVVFPISHHLVTFCKTEQRQIGHRAPAFLLETTHSLRQLSQKMWPQRTTSKDFGGIWNQQQSLYLKKVGQSLSLFPKLPG